MSRPQRSFAKPHLGRDGFTRTQLMIIVGPRLENDFHWYALHDLHIIARRVLGRQKTKAGATGAGNAIDRAVIFASVSIDFDGHVLTGSHVAQLRFFEVRRHPDVVEINDLHQFLTGSDVLADFDGAVADNSVYGSNDLGVLQV